jgi:fluoride ion exporter CrcB/FEX
MENLGNRLTHSVCTRPFLFVLLLFALLEGCLTTFASWNTQMVVMLDGTHCELGSQVIAVMFGYLVGLMGATSGFQFGRQSGLWMHNFRHAGHEEDQLQDEEALFDENNILPLHRESSTQNRHQDVELVHDNEVKLPPVPNHFYKIPLFLVAAAFLAAFLIGHIVQDIPFYRGMTWMWFVAPLGSLLRWKLSGFNQTEGKVLCFSLPKWVPWGTFMANMIATLVAALLSGISDRYSSTDNSVPNDWTAGLLFALISGFAGSLSTVSTMIRETVLLTEEHVGVARGHYYAIGTCLCGMILGLAVYSPIVRVDT